MGCNAVVRQEQQLGREQDNIEMGQHVKLNRTHAVYLITGGRHNARLLNPGDCSIVYFILTINILLLFYLAPKLCSISYKIYKILL